MSRLLDAALRYLNHGLAPIPLWPDRRKNPRLTSFTEYLTRLPTEHEWRRWAHRWPDSNIGLITGYWKNYVCLDFDDLLTFDVWAKAVWEQPATWIITTGRGVHVWYQTRCEPGVSRIYTKDGLEVLLRAKGGYCIVPPSIHHTGKPYRTACNVLPVIIDDLSYILPGWQEKKTVQGESTAERRHVINPVKVKIEDLVPAVAPHPNTRGAWLASCPFHDDNKPSAWINIDEQRFGCNACWPGLWWDVVNVYAMIEKISNGQAFSLLQKQRA